MSSNILVIAALGAGLCVGAGGTYFFMPEPEAVVRAPSEEEIIALVKANPTLIPGPILDAPTQEEALKAYREAYSRNPLRMNNEEDTLTLELGQCDKATMRPGVVCVTSVTFNSKQERPINKLVDFAKAASGDWVATNY